MSFPSISHIILHQQTNENTVHDPESKQDVRQGTSISVSCSRLLNIDGHLSKWTYRSQNWITVFSFKLKRFTWEKLNVHEFDNCDWNVHLDRNLLVVKSSCFLTKGVLIQKQTNNQNVIFPTILMSSYVIHIMAKIFGDDTT